MKMENNNKKNGILKIIVGRNLMEIVKIYLRYIQNYLNRMSSLM